MPRPKKELAPQVRLIADYKSRYPKSSKPIPNEVVAQRLAVLAGELARLKYGEDWCFKEEPPEGEPCEHLVYLWLDNRKPKGCYTYTGPAGKLIKTPYPVFYVGKGIRSRPDVHTSEQYLRARSRKSSTFKAIRAAGLPWLKITTKSFSTDWMAQALEIEIIAAIGRLDTGTGTLTNMTDGGDGAAGSIRPQSAIEATRAAWKGQHHTEETKQRLSALNKGRKHSQEFKQKVSEVHRNRVHRPKDTDWRRKLSEAQKRRPRTNCPHCKRIYLTDYLEKHLTVCSVLHPKEKPEKRPRVETAEANAKRSAAMKGRINTREQIEARLNTIKNRPPMTCPHCGKTGELIGMKRWHFDNCRQKD